jgi:pyruvate/2-oxoglutarate dehydrogenase complex dihydrolipoamide dehydrogenase (E3) component
VVFSHPPIGTIGLPEADAVAQYGADQIKTYTSTFVNLFYGPWLMEPSEKPKTAMKLVCLGPEERVTKRPQRQSSVWAELPLVRSRRLAPFPEL